MKSILMGTLEEKGTTCEQVKEWIDEWGMDGWMDGWMSELFRG
jgi:hypothetical protein